MATRAFIVPYGCDASSRLVAAADALPATEYYCPECHALLVLRRGTKRVHHFAHRSSGGCNGESVLHKTAKLLLINAIRENHAGLCQIAVVRDCSSCGASSSFRVPRDQLDDAKEEQWVGPHKCDVRATLRGEPRLYLEVRKSHRVPDTKADVLPPRWIEVDAGAIVENPRTWVALRSNLPSARCRSCKSASRALETVAQRHGITLPPACLQPRPSFDHYAAALGECWECGEEIVLFWWPGVPYAETTPPQPVPRSVQWRSSPDGASYWANTCPVCKRLQGDFEVFDADGPFADFPMRPAPEGDERSSRWITPVVYRLLKFWGGRHPGNSAA